MRLQNQKNVLILRISISFNFYIAHKQNRKTIFKKTQRFYISSVFFLFLHVYWTLVKLYDEKGKPNINMTPLFPCVKKVV